jgi:hypothetical protein
MPRSPSTAFAYNLYLKHDLARVADAFDQANIPWMVIKGVALAEAIYGGLATRPMVDNDVVVPPAHIPQAYRLLTELGFYDRPGCTLPLSRAADYEHPMHHHYPDVETGFELHWHIYAPELFRGRVEPYFERAIVRPLMGRPMLTLCNEDRLLQLATHWAGHSLNKPRVLEDIALLWNAQEQVEHRFSRAALRRRLEEVGAFDVFALALLVLERQQRLGVEVTREFRSTRATWFLRWCPAQLRQPLLEPREVSISAADKHQLTALSWSLLAPSRAAASIRRELLPSRARLSRIAGRDLSSTEALRFFLRRQARGWTKLTS